MRHLLIFIGILGSLSAATTPAGAVPGKLGKRQPAIRAGAKPASPSSGVAVTVQVISSAPVSYATWLGLSAPNPFGSATIIRYTCAKPGNVSVKVYNILGQEVATLVNRYHNGGAYSLWWDGRGNHGMLTSGVYWYRMVAGAFVQSRRLILVR